MVARVHHSDRLLIVLFPEQAHAHARGGSGLAFQVDGRRELYDHAHLVLLTGDALVQTQVDIIRDVLPSLERVTAASRGVRFAHGQFVQAQETTEAALNVRASATAPDLLHGLSQLNGL